MPTETILGIDPGYDRLGWAIGATAGQNWSALHYGVITTSPTLTLPQRYDELAIQLTAVIEAYAPTVAVIESLFFTKNQKTALKVSEARGVIIKTCLSHNLKIAEFTPPQVKLAVTGYGRADKKAVEKMVRMQFKLGGEKIGDDAIDALAAMLTYASQSTLAYAS